MIPLETIEHSLFIKFAVTLWNPDSSSPWKASFLSGDSRRQNLLEETYAEPRKKIWR